MLLSDRVMDMNWEPASFGEFLSGSCLVSENLSLPNPEGKPSLAIKRHSPPNSWRRETVELGGNGQIYIGWDIRAQKNDGL